MREATVWFNNGGIDFIQLTSAQIAPNGWVVGYRVDSDGSKGPRVSISPHAIQMVSWKDDDK